VTADVPVSSTPRSSALSRAGNVVLRRAILAAAGSSAIQRFVRRFGMRFGAGRFVAGETLDECVAALRVLNDQGLHANTTILGEGVRSEREAVAVAAEYERVLEQIAAEGLKVNIALKLTHLGLELDEEVAYVNVARVIDAAARLGNFIRIDIEDARVVDTTLRIYRRLRDGGYDNVGCVLQAYLYRSEDDLRELLSLRPNVRIVKGAYLEPPTVAYPRKAAVDAAYIRLLERALSGGAYVCVATHDERLIEHAIAYADRHGIGRNRFELQMLYGVRPQMQLDLVRRGYKVLVATPYGLEWYPYLMRRLGERPANLVFFARSLFRR
jgi:proline dehydrogenase